MYQKPKSRPLLGSILGAGIRMATDFRNNNLDLGAHKIPDNQKGSQKAARTDRLLSGKHVVLLPTRQAFKETMRTQSCSRRSTGRRMKSDTSRTSSSSQSWGPPLTSAFLASAMLSTRVWASRMGVSWPFTTASRGAPRRARPSTRPRKRSGAGLDMAPSHYQQMGRRGQEEGCPCRRQGLQPRSWYLSWKIISTPALICTLWHDGAMS